MPRVRPVQVRLRRRDFDTAMCSICRYYKDDFCKVLEREVDDNQVCDAYQGAEGKYKSFSIADKDASAFARGMRRTQPYKHIVVKGLDTPVGFLLIIHDTMKPKPHTFSLDMKFSSEHLAREHHWRQSEIDNLIRIGKKA